MECNFEMEVKMKEKSKVGSFIKDLLLVLGIGAIVGYFTCKETRYGAREKILSFRKFVLGFIQAKKLPITNEGGIDKLPGIPKNVFDGVRK